MRLHVSCLTLCATLLAACRSPASAGPGAPDNGATEANPAPVAQKFDLIIRGGSVLGPSGAFAANPGIGIKDGRFGAIGVGPNATAEKDLELPSSAFLIPGLFDLHGHHGAELFNRRRVDETHVNPVVFLANGVTSVFPAGEMNPGPMMEARRRIDRGEQIGARILSSGPYFGPARPGWKNDEVTVDQIRAEVRALAAQGVRGFKAKRPRADHLQALIDEAHAVGLTVTGHLGSGYRDTVNPRDAIAMGIDRVEHFLGGDALPADRSAYDSLVNVTPDTPAFERIADLFIQKGVYFDATVSAYGYFGARDPEVYTPWTDERRFFTPWMRQQLAARGERKVFEQFETIYWVKLKTLKAFYDRGGADLITVGTDQPTKGDYLPGFSIHRELHALVKAGLPPLAAIRAATINAARAMKLDGELGSIEPGKRADLVVLPKNPLEDIRNTRAPTRVVKDGVIYDPQELLRSVEGQYGPRDAGEAAQWQ